MASQWMQSMRSINFQQIHHPKKEIVKLFLSCLRCENTANGSSGTIRGHQVLSDYEFGGFMLHLRQFSKPGFAGSWWTLHFTHAAEAHIDRLRNNRNKTSIKIRQDNCDRRIPWTCTIPCHRPQYFQNCLNITQGWIYQREDMHSICYFSPCFCIKEVYS